MAEFDPIDYARFMPEAHIGVIRVIQKIKLFFSGELCEFYWATILSRVDALIAENFSLSLSLSLSLPPSSSLSFFFK